ncbi:MAG: DUF4215 domain-containing protein, partial [Myxococcales bacterium]|nr:DUF4215 domain-containing protein [Myxococcales bacterium]
MGRGFFYDDRPLRDIDEADRERIWPDDVGEIHDTGIIYSGALWDMRKAAIDLLGDVEGRAFAARIYVGTLQRATDIPSSLLEALVTDDDDGDLGNGTPNECLIREAFGRHGLRTVSASIENVGALAATAGETTTPVTVTLGGLSVACTGDEVDHVTLSWLPRSDADSPATGSTLMSPGPGDTFTGDLPLPDPGQVGLYRVEVSFFDGTSTLFPDNRGDPYYEVYRGETVELYCDDFEADPFAPGPDAWTHGAEAGDDPWQWGPPLGLATDPDAAYSGDNVVGMWLDSDDGQYQPSSVSWLQSPVIDVGDYSDVRLHYRRWLGVEDGFYDKATIYANGEVAWQNYDSGQSLDASRHTLDADWVFKDVALSTRIYDGTVQLMFELTSDEGLEFGGWTLDDVCVVANPNSVCGDGVITGSEQCDDGDDNADAPDACRVNCRRARCGDGIVDQLEQCDDGGRADGDGCSRICELEGEPDGCCSS